MIENMHKNTPRRDKMLSLSQPHQKRAATGAVTVMVWLSTAKAGQEENTGRLITRLTDQLLNPFQCLQILLLLIPSASLVLSQSKHCRAVQV